MHIHRTSLLALLLAGLAVLTSGCPGLAPGSRAYRPLPQWEAKFFAQARRDVFPNDVRQHPDGFTNTLVVWTGVITNIEFFSDGSSRVARFTADHHYFDWIEDISIQRERFFCHRVARGRLPQRGAPKLRMTDSLLTSLHWAIC